MFSHMPAPQSLQIGSAYSCRNAHHTVPWQKFVYVIIPTQTVLTQHHLNDPQTVWRILL